MADLIRKHAFVTGRVQGVGYRFTAESTGTSMGLTGWVRNLADGRVETEFQGDAASVNQFMAWLHDGPPSARVTDVEVRSLSPIPDESAFETRYDARGY